VARLAGVVIGVLACCSPQSWEISTAPWRSSLRHRRVAILRPGLQPVLASLHHAGCTAQPVRGLISSVLLVVLSPSSPQARLDLSDADFACSAAEPGIVSIPRDSSSAGWQCAEPTPGHVHYEKFEVRMLVGADQS